jgi:DNA (cytosine-5)-methyltransferase 1
LAGMRTSTNDFFERKLRRLQDGEPPRVLDLFSGCGGLSLGFHGCGCIPLGGVELDPAAAASYSHNFHGGRREFAAPRDITKLAPEDAMVEFGKRGYRSAVDVIVGGPPCPTFTRVGRAKLREVQRHPKAFLLDDRSQLYRRYLAYVHALRPVALLMENVPDFLNWGGRNLAEDICDELEDSGYACAYTLLNAARYGVPQMRERFVLVAIHAAVGNGVVFPAATNCVDLPRGYDSTREVALRTVRTDAGVRKTRFVDPPPEPDSLPPPVTVRDAISDLPPITSHLDGSLRRGPRRFRDGVPYRPNAHPSAFATRMRTWRGFAAREFVWDHVIRSLGPRDERLFRLLSPGDDYPKAHALAEQLFDQEVAARALVAGSAAYRKLRSEYVPPYDHRKFPNKWRKIEPDAPARTLMAHLGKDGYSHIHYDSRQARVISVREAARLQSFPDGFRFEGTMNPAFRQIGNAVPPLLAWHLATCLLGQLGWRLARDPWAEAVPGGVGAEPRRGCADGAGY